MLKVKGRAMFKGEPGNEATVIHFPTSAPDHSPITLVLLVVGNVGKSSSSLVLLS